MSALNLHPGVHAAVHETDLVVLDARRGDYLCLPGAGPLVVLQAGWSSVWVKDPELAEVLEDLGLAAAGLPMSGRTPPPPAAREDLMGLGARPSAASRLRMCASALDMLIHYAGRPFHRMARWGRALEAPRPSSPARVAAAAADFRWMLPFVPFQGECLFRAFMLKVYLARAGLGAALVVGVQTWPFQAHAWVQAGPMVLDDTVEHVRAFTPILTLP
jgi:hypothetical protein